jgi:hypothetical protein
MFYRWVYHDTHLFSVLSQRTGIAHTVALVWLCANNKSIPVKASNVALRVRHQDVQLLTTSTDQHDHRVNWIVDGRCIQFDFQISMVFLMGSGCTLTVWFRLLRFSDDSELTARWWFALDVFLVDVSGYLLILSALMVGLSGITLRSFSYSRSVLNMV